MLEIKTVTNGPIAKQVECVCHDTLPWLISVSLDLMRISVSLAALVVVLTVGGCAEEPHSVSLPGPGPAAIPPPPSHPKIEGQVKSVSSADIREVIRLKQQDMVKEYGRVLPIYTVRVHSKNHIEVQFWGADGIEYWRDARRVKGKWKFDELVPVILAGGTVPADDCHGKI